MITQIKMTLEKESGGEAFRPEWAYRLYSECLREVPFAYGEKLHSNNVTPVSQYLKRNGEKIIWTVNLLGEEAEKYLKPVFLEKQVYHIGPEIKVVDQKVQTIADADSLLAMAAGGSGGLHRLCFETATAFKSQGQYTNLLTIKLIIQSLIKKWNGCFPEMPIEDEDGQGMDALIAGLHCLDYQLHDQRYTLKGTCIHGAAGNIVIKNALKGFHKEFTDALLLFSGYSGVGIKTALGMGGVRHTFK